MQNKQDPAPSQRRTILGMLDTTPATQARRVTGFTTGDRLPLDLEFDWEPRPLARAIRTGRRFRWTVLIAALLLAAGAFAGTLAGMRYLDHHVNDRGTLYGLVAGETASALEDVRGAVAVIVDAGAQPPDVAAAADSLLRLEVLSGRLDDAASAGLLHLPDWIPSPALDDLAKAREQLRKIGGSVHGLTARLRLVTDYRLGTADILSIPSLPSPDNPIPAADARQALSTALAHSVAVLGSLPDDPGLATHRDAIADLLLWLGEWQGRYLAVLQAGDLEGAVDLERDAAARIDGTRLALLDPLSEIGRWADGLITSMEHDAVEARILSGT